MNQLERYSLHSALKPKSFFWEENYFPLVSKKYITIDSSPDRNGNSYFDWIELIGILHPFLSKLNIDIVLIGEHIDNIPKDFNVLNFTKLNLNQNLYICNRGLLHISLPGYINHVLSQNNKNCISLFKNNGSQFFCDKHRDTHFKIESVSNINQINPYHIAETALKFLQVDFINPYENSFFAGYLSNTKTLEIIPDFIPDQNFFPQSVINIRADLNFNEQNIFHFCQGRAAGIICSNEFSTELLHALHGQQIRFSISLNKSISIKYLRQLSSFGFKFDLFTHNQNELYDLRLNYIDYNVEFYKLKTKKDLDKSINICNNTIFKSSKVLYSKNKKFASKAHWILNQELSSDFNQIVDTKDFWCDLDFMHIYNTKNE